MTEHRDGDWMQTFTGLQFWPFDPRPEDVCIEDIAHSLALQCRFAGHCRTHYSVAEHCVRASRLPYLKRYTDIHCSSTLLSVLLHDATEAYLVDIPRPLKRDRAFSAYKPIEDRLASVIAARFRIGVGPEEPAVKHCDEIMLATEARDLMSAPPADWHLVGKPDHEVIRPWPWEYAELRFIERFAELTKAVEADNVHWSQERPDGQ